MGAPGKANITISQGDDDLREWVWESPPGTPVDITGATIRMQVREGPADSNPDLIGIDESGTPDGQVTLSDPVNGTFETFINRTATKKLVGKQKYLYDVEVTLAGARTTIVAGNVSVYLEVTE